MPSGSHQATPERNAPCPCGSGKKYKKCCLAKADPIHIPSLLEKAVNCHQSGRLGEAERMYQEVLSYEPRQIQAYNNLGAIYLQAGDIHRARQCFAKAIELQPGYAESHHNLGLAWLRLERWEEAKRSLLEAVKLKPDYADAYYNLGTAYGKQGQQEQAIAAFGEALRFNPFHADALHNLAIASFKADDYSRAADYFKRSLALQPDNFDAYANLSVIFLHRGEVAQALACLDRGLALQPDNAVGLSNRLFALHYLSASLPLELAAEHRRFGERFESAFKPWSPYANSPNPERRLKIGYVSPDLRLHSVAFFMEPVLEHHDRRQVEVYCYYNNTLMDTVAERLKGHADHWIFCKDMGDDALAARIRDDGIDILVDLAGHTACNRLLTFARKPAPVQVSYLGYPATSGLTAMDWRLVTGDTDPEGAERWHSERLYRLPRSLWCYRAEPDLPEAAHTTPARTSGRITFGSMNNIAKVSDAAVQAWSELLARVPGSRLVMTNLPDRETATRVQRIFAAHGVGQDRLVLHGKLPRYEYYAFLNGIDIALDPFPYNGTTTTCQALWMGVPVVTLIGETSVARSGYALLKAIGLAELAADSVPAYVAVAVELARDLDRLDALRGGMRARLQASALCDEAGFTREIEAAYRAMWRDWCAAAAPVAQ